MIEDTCSNAPQADASGPFLVPLFLVPLTAEHPGFLDADYRRRRDAIARIALEHERGSAVEGAPYSDAEHAVWAKLCAPLLALQAERASPCHDEAARLLELPMDRIPQFEELNAQLRVATGFRMEPVAGLVEARDFLSALADGVFLSTQYIRHASRPGYTPEPDVVHEVLGHARSLALGRVAELSRSFGRAARAAVDPEEIRRIERAYWWTLEFGVTRAETGALRAFGAGLLSSTDELRGFDSGPELRAWSLDSMAREPYDPSGPQQRLFVTPSESRLFDELGAWLESGAWATPDQNSGRIAIISPE